jgi:hypothetical protein
MRLLRFFYRGPGVLLVIVGAVLLVCYAIQQGQEHEKAEAAKHQVQRELGNVNPSANVDKSMASKEVLLADRRLNGIAGSQPAQPEPANVPVSVPRQRAALQTLTLFYAQVPPTEAATPAPTVTPKVEQWLPPSIFIPCVLVNTVESSHINTPVVGEVIRDCCQNGHLIVPAGTLVSAFAQSGAVRDRIEVAGNWLFVFSDGRQLKAPGMACVREADPANQQFGIEDGSAGLQGELIESDHWANAKAFIALLMTSTVQAGTAAASSVVQRGYGGGVGLPDTSPILAKYLDQLLNGSTGDSRFVRVRAGTEFYIFPTDTILPSHRSIVTTSQVSVPGSESAPSTDPSVQAAKQMEREILRQSQQPQQTEGNPSPLIKY